MSKQTEHTPGPWQVLPEESDRDYLRIRGTRLGQRYKIANVHHDPLAYYPWHADETRANARLIAESPVLLALVEEAIGLLGGTLWPRETTIIKWLIRAQAAVTKARGEER